MIVQGWQLAEVGGKAVQDAVVVEKELAREEMERGAAEVEAAVQGDWEQAAAG